MARELNFQGGNDVIKYQDTTNSLDLNLSVDGVPFDLSQLDSMTLKIGNSNGYLLQIPVDLTSITDPQSGNVSVHLDSDTMTKLVPDDYNLEVWVEINPVKVNAGSNDATISLRDGDLSSEQAIFPSDGNLVFTVDDNIKASDTDSINAYAVDEVWDAVKSWETDTAKSISTNLSSQLLDEIIHWQGDISEKLKNELLQDLANDESNIQKQLNDVLTQSLDDLINKEVGDAKQAISTDLHNAMVSDVANQISIIKPQVTDDLHNSLSSELSNELTQAIQNWENSTDNDLNNKLAQAIVDKTNTMQTDLSNQLTNYLAGKLSDYETNSTNTITANITAQLTQNLADQFNQEDSKIRADLEGLVKGQIQNDITNTLQQMQQNGDIYATKQQLTDFENQMNTSVNNLALNNNNVMQWREDLPSDTDLNNLQTQGIYWFHGFIPKNAPLSDNNVGTITITVTGDCITQTISYISGNLMFYRTMNKTGWFNEWQRFATMNDINTIANQLNDFINKSDKYNGSVSDANEATQEGTYGLDNEAKNVPVYGQSDSIFLHVWNIPGSNIIEQLFIPMWHGGPMNELWFRSYGGANWQPWQKIATTAMTDNLQNQINNIVDGFNGVANDVNALIGKRDFYFHQINHDTPLSNIKTPGIYRSDVRQSGYQDTPDGSNNFTLVVEYDGYFTHQTYFSDHVWRRDGNRNFTWYQIANSDDVKQLETKVLDGIIDNIVDNDLNSMNTPGTYFSTNHNIKNTPSQIGAAWFIIEVKQGIDMTFQTLRDWNNDVYVRILAGSPASWQDWKKLASDADVQNLLKSNTMSYLGTLHNGDDLNNLMWTTDGYYDCYAEDVKNLPVPNKHWFILRVISRGAFTYMDYVDSDANHYERNAGGDPRIWHKWKKVIVDDDLNTVINQVNSNISSTKDDIKNLQNSINDLNISDFKVRDFAFENGKSILDVIYMEDGYYHVNQDWSNAPDGFSGYGIILKRQIGTLGSWPDVDVTLRDSNGNQWINTFSSNKWLGWKKLLSNEDTLTLQGSIDQPFDNMTKTGIYFNEIPSQIMGMQGNPDGSSGHGYLIVIQFSDSYVYQRYFNDHGYDSERARINGNWNNWKSSFQYYDQLTGPNIDFNNITKPGVYPFSASGQPSNTPDGCWRGVLTVTNMGYDGVTQEFFADNGTWCTKHYRMFSQVTQSWTPWAQEVTHVDIDTATNQLQNNINSVSQTLTSQLENTLSNKGDITNYGSDFNTFIGQGIYNLKAKWSSDFQNGPDFNTSGPSYGRDGGLQLIVTAPNPGIILQTVVTTKNTYTRHLYNGFWSEWDCSGDTPSQILRRQGYYVEDSKQHTTPNQWRINLWNIDVQNGHNYLIKAKIDGQSSLAISYNGDITSTDNGVQSIGSGSIIPASQDGTLTIGLTGDNEHAMTYSDFCITDMTVMNALTAPQYRG